jgi:hypothetical protein
MLRKWFALEADKETLEAVRRGVLVHRTRVKYLPQIISSRIARDPVCNARVRLSGDFGFGPAELVYTSLVRDWRIIDFDVFRGAAGRRLTDFVFCFLGEPGTAQVRQQALRGRGDAAVIRIRGSDVLSDARRRLFWRPQDKAVVVKGGYEGPANVDPLPAGLDVPVF